MHSNKITPHGLAFGAVVALAAGFVLASLFASLAAGGGGLGDASITQFWYETPLYLGYASKTFYNGLIIIGICVAVSMLAYIGSRQGKEHHGTARWAENGTLARAGFLKPYAKITGPLFGKTSGPRGFGRYLTNGEQAHSLVVAPTRAGKGVGVVIPTLLTFKGSVLALDVKGELFELTSRARRARGDRVYKFAPLDPEGRTHGYNPVLDIVALPPERRFAETRRLAVNLIVPKNKGAEGFIDGARDLFVAGILACIERGTPTIGAVYDLFAQPGEKYKLFAQLAEETNSLEARRIFDNMAGNDTKILTSYTSILGDSGLNLWADPQIKAATTRSDFSLSDLRRRRTVVYLCVSPNDLEVIAPLMRLFFQHVVATLQRAMPGRDEPHQVLFLLDEFKHLGRLESIETAVTTIAGYGGRFMFIIQSLSALTGVYEEAGKQNFLSNTGVQVFMATADEETPNYISKAIGEHSFKAKSISHSRGRRGDVSVQVSEQGAPLLRPEQIRLLDEGQEIVLIKGRPPVRLSKIRYYEDRVLRRLFEAQQGPLPQPARHKPDPAPVAPERVPHMSPGASAVDGGFDAAELANEVLPSAPDRGEAIVDAVANTTPETRGGHAPLDRQPHPAPPLPPDTRAPPAPQQDPGAEGEIALLSQRLLLDRIIALQQRQNDGLARE